VGGEANANGIRLAFDVHGSGSDPVLLVGPIGASGAFWVPFQVPAFVLAEVSGSRTGRDA
jgi:hypothetical protein